MLHEIQRWTATAVILLGALLSFSILGVRLDIDRLPEPYVWTLISGIGVGYLVYVVVSAARFIKYGEL
jgi:hypothetical protein